VKVPPRQGEDEDGPSPSVDAAMPELDVSDRLIIRRLSFGRTHRSSIVEPARSSVSFRIFYDRVGLYGSIWRSTKQDGHLDPPNARRSRRARQARREQKKRRYGSRGRIAGGGSRAGERGRW
jgi:hypothetical protein